MSEVIGKHYLDLDIHQNNYVSFTCKQDNSAEHIYVTIYDNGEHINNLTTLLTSLDVKIETPDSRHLKLSTSDVWQRCKKDDVGAILITSNNISTYRPYILDIAVGEYVRKGTSELITITNDTAEIHLPQSVFLENGKCKGEIILIQDDNQLATMDFQINIIKSVYTDKEIIDDAYTESEVVPLKNYMSEYAKHAEDSASLSKSWAVGGTGTRTGEDTNNSKYYSEQSKYYAKQAEQLAPYDYQQVLQELEDIKSSIATDLGNLRFSITENNLLHVERKE